MAAGVRAREAEAQPADPTLSRGCRSYAKLIRAATRISDTNRRTDRRRPAGPDSGPFRASQNRLDPNLDPAAIHPPWNHAKLQA
jgi:hypothetical protein